MPMPAQERPRVAHCRKLASSSATSFSIYFKRKAGSRGSVFDLDQTARLTHLQRAEPTVRPSIALQNNVFHHRIDLLLPGAAAEHAVMADAGLHVVALAGGPQRRAHV